VQSVALDRHNEYVSEGIVLMVSEEPEADSKRSLTFGADRVLDSSNRLPQLDRWIEVRADETLYRAARRHGVRIVGACGGRGTCGSCLVRLQEGGYARLQDGAGDEAAAVEMSGAAAAESAHDVAASGRRWLRACQVCVRSDGSAEIAPRSLAPVVRTETDRGEAEFLPLDPVIEGCALALPAATLADPLDDTARVLRGLAAAGVADAGRLGIDLAAARTLPALLRGACVHGAGMAGWSPSPPPASPPSAWRWIWERPTPPPSWWTCPAASAWPASGWKIPRSPGAPT
jgi:ferredoxin